MTRGDISPVMQLQRMVLSKIILMTLSNGNIFRVTGPLCVEFTGQRWIPLTKASDAELLCFLWSASWINNRQAGDLRRHRAHFDVIVMITFSSIWFTTKISNLFNYFSIILLFLKCLYYKQSWKPLRNVKLTEKYFNSSNENVFNPLV